MICTEYDSYLDELQIDRGRAIWVARLCDGREVFGDDSRPGLDQWNAWVRLGEYCRENGLCIVDVRLRFRSRTIPAALPHAEGYYLCHGLAKNFEGGGSILFLTVGHLSRGAVYAQQWKLPTLELIGRDVRDPETSPAECLIRNPSQCHVETGNEIH